MLSVVDDYMLYLALLLAGPFVLVFLLFLSSKVFGSFSSSASGKERKMRGENELLQLLLLGDLLSRNESMSASANEIQDEEREESE